MFDSHLGCPVPDGGESHTGFFEWALDPLGGEVWEESYGLPHGLVKYTVYCRELSFIEDSKVCDMICDLSRCSIMAVLWEGLSFLLASVVASLRTSFVMCLWCSLKSKVTLI